jgi:hypothetical protein
MSWIFLQIHPMIRLTARRQTGSEPRSTRRFSNRP